LISTPRYCGDSTDIIFFLKVYKQGLFGRRYTWIMTGGSIYENWIRDADVSKLSCSRENLYEAAN
jgi:hypothetical protein